MAQNAVHTPRVIRKCVFDAPKLLLGMVWHADCAPAGASKKHEQKEGEQSVAQNAVHTLRVIRKGVFDAPKLLLGMVWHADCGACGCKQEA